MYVLTENEILAVSAGAKGRGSAGSAYNRAMGNPNNPCSPRAFQNAGLDGGEQGAFGAAGAAAFATTPLDLPGIGAAAVGGFLGGAFVADIFQGAECVGSLMDMSGDGGSGGGGGGPGSLGRISLE